MFGFFGKPKITQKDIALVEFLHDRLYHAYKENKNIDFMVSTRKLISKMYELGGKS